MQDRSDNRRDLYTRIYNLIRRDYLLVQDMLEFSHMAK